MLNSIRRSSLRHFVNIQFEQQGLSCRQEDGGVPRPAHSVLPSGFPESTASPGGPDPVRGDVPGHQHLHLLQRPLQQAGRHVNGGGAPSEAAPRHFWATGRSTSKEQAACQLTTSANSTHSIVWSCD